MITGGCARHFYRIQRCSPLPCLPAASTHPSRSSAQLLTPTSSLTPPRSSSTSTLPPPSSPLPVPSLSPHQPPLLPSLPPPSLCPHLCSLASSCTNSNLPSSCNLSSQQSDLLVIPLLLITSCFSYPCTPNTCNGGAAAHLLAAFNFSDWIWNTVGSHYQSLQRQLLFMPDNHPRRHQC